MSGRTRYPQFLGSGRHSWQREVTPDCPHDLILGSCPWVKGSYANGKAIRIPLASLHPKTVSFTYGDSFPAMRVRDGKPYRGQIYTLAELPAVIDLYGLPQKWNPDGRFGPERYIEAQL